jgi:hopanoid biosynthesis associated protein HpnK
VLSSASLMVTAPAAAEAVQRAHRLKTLRVGLHLVLVDGSPALGPAAAAALVRSDGLFDPDPLRAGLRFFLLPGIRRLLAAEIRAQFEAFRATGLPLDHVNGHKHSHLHPTVARLIVEIGCDYGMRAVRLPVEPVGPLRHAFPNEQYRPAPYNFAGAALRRRLRRAGLATSDQVFGLAWSGAMTEARVLGLLPHLPDGVSEIYFHPAVARTPALEAAMPGYRNREEFEALTSPAVRRRIDELGIVLTTYGELAALT